MSKSRKKSGLWLVERSFAWSRIFSFVLGASAALCIQSLLNSEPVSDFARWTFVIFAGLSLVHYVKIKLNTSGLIEFMKSVAGENQRLRKQVSDQNAGFFNKWQGKGPQGSRR